MKRQTGIYRLDAIATMLEDLKDWKTELVLPAESHIKALLPTRFNRTMYYDNGKNDHGHYLKSPSACAIGFAALHPFFNDMGLKMNDYMEPTYQGASYPEEAASLFFGIPEDDAWELFGQHGPNNPKRVAEKIRQYVRDNLL